MKALDIIILIPVLFGAYKGFKKGLLMELVSLVALLLATLLSFKLLDKGIDVLANYIDKNQTFVPYLAFVLIFVLVLFLVTYIGKATKKFLDVTLIGKLDDLAGGILGALKWAFAFSVLLWLSQSAGINPPESYTNGTIIYPYLIVYGPQIIDFFSALLPQASSLIESIKEKLFVIPS